MPISDEQKQEVYDFYAEDYKWHLEITKFMAKQAAAAVVISSDDFPFIAAKATGGANIGLPPGCSDEFRNNANQGSELIGKTELANLKARQENGLNNDDREYLQNLQDRS